MALCPTVSDGANPGFLKGPGAHNEKGVKLEIDQRHPHSDDNSVLYFRSHYDEDESTTGMLLHACTLTYTDVH